MKIIKLLSVMIIGLILLYACQNTSSSTSEDQTEHHKIVTSIYPIEYIVSEIGVDVVTVETVVPSGADAHSYEPSTKTMLELSEADGFFYIGEGMESFSETMAETVNNEGVQTLELAKHHDLFETIHNEEVAVTAESNEDEHEGHNHGEFDPHFWLDPTRMVEAGDVILDQLITMYPEQEDTLKQNFETFKDNMNDLDQQYQSSFENEINILVTHKSFSYLEQRYPIKQYSIRGLSSSQEPSQKELLQLFDQIENMELEHIILETNSEDRLAKTIAEEMELTPYYLSNLSSRTEEQINQNKDYYDIMIDNLNVLKEIKGD
ncbi:metal ABC transporter solute-binding protein, Zn/Mn family [Piscibacillus salipiscarius]|uniref:Metal ABC transporter solute-binding protein, Zn/Mn family n=1 Tax=Piscibacillus salipiscarius TaxID=299480 RepID=A0ABW5QD42_9BACI|nr:zinc ABC transporter substrate-binding protein [Piscibacillus salipiscarius]